MIGRVARVGALICAALCSAAVAIPAERARLDLTEPRARLEAYIRANGDTSGAPVATWASGRVYAYVPGEKPRALFGLEVLGMSRFQKIEGGYLRLHREIGFYTDLATGEVLKTWNNPWLQREVEVIPIQNDPVNRRFTVENTSFSILESGDDVMFFREVPLRYPNPLDPATYPQNSSGEFYEAIEMFNTFAQRRELEDARLTTVHSTGSWTRFGPWLPWMEMGSREGYLLYHSRSLKPRDGLTSLPAKLRDYVARQYPKYLEAPDRFTSPDETSWTFFKKVLDARKAAPPVAPAPAQAP